MSDENIGKGNKWRNNVVEIIYGVKIKVSEEGNRSKVNGATLGLRVS